MGAASTLATAYLLTRFYPTLILNNTMLPSPLKVALTPPPQLVALFNNNGIGIGIGIGAYPTSTSQNLSGDILGFSQGVLMLAGLTLLGIVAGQLPDIDQPTSTIANSGRAVGRLLKQRGILGFFVKLVFGIINILPQTLAWFANRFFSGHRGVVHSLLATMVLSIGFGYITYLTLGSAFYGLLFASAYLSHLVVDMLTRSGIKLLLPLSKHDFWLLPPGLRFKADSEWQNTFVQALAVGVIGLVGVGVVVY